MTTRRIPATDPRLGRHVEHDERSRAFTLPMRFATTAWHTKTIRIYDPTPNPNQTIGNCTGCSKAMQLNAVGNRKRGVILDMGTATGLYSKATVLDTFPGTYLPDDTGSSGLAAAKAAQFYGLGGAYSWLFNGADGVADAIMQGHAVSVGTRWDNNMFTPDERGQVHPGGGVAGGHQWTVRGFNPGTDLFTGRCWWGDFRDFYISRTDLDALLDDDGDAHVQARA